MHVDYNMYRRNDLKRFEDRWLVAPRCTGVELCLSTFLWRYEVGWLGCTCASVGLHGNGMLATACECVLITPLLLHSTISCYSSCLLLSPRRPCSTSSFSTFFSLFLLVRATNHPAPSTTFPPFFLLQISSVMSLPALHCLCIDQKSFLC